MLDAEHAGLDDVKERITEYLAVRKRRADRGLGVVGGRRGGAVLALVGPPGVGKTSLGESVAHAMGREFVRVALGGVRDEAEIRGHRRTYVGALPGRIVRAIKEAGSMNPVVLLDEIDKVGSDFRGDPAAALLEVLDPAQNHTFRDHYLEVELDLSDVVFLATANVLESIPEALLDRMEMVRLDGYTEDEKVVIARDHLLPRQLERAGLKPGEVVLEEASLRKLAGEYTREAGVRTLERSISRLLRKVAAQHELGDRELPFAVRPEDLRELIGRPHHVPESAQDPAERRTSVPGVATGLAVTGAGGDVLFVEASLADPETGAAGLTLTGQLGDVMKESAQIALSFLRSHGAELELPVTGLKDRGVHIHFPAGAVPQGRAERGHHDDDRPRLPAERPARPHGRGHDRRGLPHRPGPADRRREAEAARRAPGGHHDGRDPQAERGRPGRRPGRDPGEAGGPPGDGRPAGPGDRPRPGGGAGGRGGVTPVRSGAFLGDAPLRHVRARARGGSGHGAWGGSGRRSGPGRGPVRGEGGDRSGAKAGRGRGRVRDVSPDCHDRTHERRRLLGSHRGVEQPPRHPGRAAGVAGGELLRRPAEKSVAFQVRLEKACGAAHTRALWRAADRIEGGGCTDDGFHYFTLWLVGQGRKVYEAVLADPDALADLPEVRALAGRHRDDWDDDEWPEWEELDYVAQDAYDELTGQEDDDGRSSSTRSRRPRRRRTKRGGAGRGRGTRGVRAGGVDPAPAHRPLPARDVRL